MSFTLYPTGVTATTSAAPAELVLVEQNSFQMQMNDDLEAVFFNQGEFAEKAKSKYVHSNGQTEYYAVIFDTPTTNLGIASNVEVTLMKPQVQIIERQLVNAITKDDTIDVRGVSYHVENFISDGVGVTTLFLSRR